MRASLLPLLALCGALFGGCDVGPGGSGSGRRVPPGEVLPVGEYPDGSAGLHQLWTDILSAARKDDRGRVHDLLASMHMPQDELQGLLGRARAEALWPRYQMIFGSLANTGAAELVGLTYENKYEDVVVLPVDPARAEGPDRNVLRALVASVPLYSVRVKRKDADKGLRYDFFVYLNGHWRTGGFLGKYIEIAEIAPAPNKGG